ncbi:MDS1 and EVI1 complex locus protein EVI1-A-like isoform X10 [Mercenaria mercenaria]|uniref:MDS1 and EVI1 complex locus protein EVI1-A-like isoform X10 n=1 Tax=Mercenaria mercenaria TaxID=6596 RepID=UPI00234EC62B|nr:MDS1 and EVI1 complex locus protein EVI1-A-like isoform X10 [Mercenaria mercenaria]
MAKPDMDVIKEIPGYKVILKAVLKSQIQQLVEQLASTTDEESVILTASVADGTLCHLGSDSGKVFLEDHEDIKSQFLGFCLKRHHKKKQEKERQEAQEREEALARSMAPTTPPRYGGPRFMPQRSPRYPSPQHGLHPVALSRVSPGGRMRSPGARHQPYPMARPPRPSLNFDQQGQVPGPGPRTGNRIEGQVIKIEPDDEDEKSNQSVNDSVQTPTSASVPGNSEPPSPSTKPSTPSQTQGQQASDNDDAKSESSTSTIPNEASDLKLSDTAPPGGLSLDSDLSNLISASTSVCDSNVEQPATSHDSASEPQTPTGLDPNISVKLEAVADSEMDLEITGVELGQTSMQEQMSSQEWMSNVQNVMQGATGSSADMASQQSYRSMKGGSSEMNSFLSSMDTSALQIAQTIERFRCQLCNKVNGTKAALERHMFTHTGERKYVCSYCRKSFTISSSLYRHIRSLHDRDFVPK